MNISGGTKWIWTKSRKSNGENDRWNIPVRNNQRVRELEWISIQECRVSWNLWDTRRVWRARVSRFRTSGWPRTAATTDHRWAQPWVYTTRYIRTVKYSTGADRVVKHVEFRSRTIRALGRPINGETRGRGRRVCTYPGKDRLNGS